jgi:hypothetical protein
MAAPVSATGGLNMSAKKNRKPAPKRPKHAAPSTNRRLTRAPTTTTPKPHEDEKLKAWLQEQADKLKLLNATTSKLKLDFVANAVRKGAILKAVKEKLKDTSIRFEDWVTENADIGYSTADLWIDIHEHPEVIRKLADSNALELSITNIRAAIRDDRQAQGNGKPGSGKLSATSIKKSFVEAKKYQAMKNKGVSIREIADKEGTDAEHVMDAVAIFDLSKEKQKQIKDGDLDPKKAVQAQSKLIGQAMHELPNYTLLPKHTAPSSRQFMSDLLQIKTFLKSLVGPNLTEYPPELRESISQMADHFATDLARMQKVWDEWQAAAARAETNNSGDEEPTDPEKPKKKPKQKGPAK